MKNCNIIIDKNKLNTAETFDELADIAVDVLRQMSLSGRPIAEICGPVSTGGLGSIEKNLARIKKAIVIAEKKGLQTFDMPLFEKAIEKLSYKYPKTNGYCLPILDIFYKRLFESGYINKALFLPDWQSSYGARWERNLVKGLNINIEEYPEEWLKEIDLI